MKPIRLNHLTLQSDPVCTCDNRFDGASCVRQLYQYRRSTESLHTHIVPLSSMGGKTNYNKALAVLKHGTFDQQDDQNYISKTLMAK